MVVCQICKKEYKIITQQHLDKHNILVEEYKIKYPNCPLLCEITRNKYKEGTKEYNKKHGSPNAGIPKSKSHIENLKIAAKNRPKEHYEKIANNKERNRKIGEAKKEWWNKKDKQYRTNFIKEKVIPKIIENEGLENYLKRLRNAGIEGHNKARELGKKKIANTFEKVMIGIIIDTGYSCIEQFEIDGYYYDSYIPEKNLIIEFDGDYWHAKSIEDCINERLKKQWRIDRYKDGLAIKSGYNIIRIRESEKNDLVKILQ
tara:strand:+ start:111 stop:887 length:777 start_codon:yes stop_codon:yes gene_type:complete